MIGADDVRRFLNMKSEEEKRKELNRLMFNIHMQNELNYAAGKSKCTEIYKLRDMLKEAEIEHFFHSTGEDSYRIVYRGKNADDDAGFVCSVVQGYGTDGYNEGLLEISGLLTSEESKYDTVKGYLTAEDVFSRIKRHWDLEKADEEKAFLERLINILGIQDESDKDIKQTGEIKKLADMLNRMNIPFTFEEENKIVYRGKFKGDTKVKPFCVVTLQTPDKKDRKAGLLEFSGVKEKKDKIIDGVTVDIDAREVFDRIKWHWENIANQSSVKCMEIYRLAEMLAKEGIPYRLIPQAKDYYQLSYYGRNDRRELCRVLQGPEIPGFEEGMLEIFGGFRTAEEKETGAVHFADEVFRRIRYHWNNS